jgi:serine phosphatase RsbU (regulator of sigma subunit)
MLSLPARLDAVRRSGLLDTGPEEPFDRLTRLACELLDAPFGFVTVVDERRSFWKSCIGVAAVEIADRQNPVDESFCQYVIASDDAVIIDDARLDATTRHNPSIESMGVIAWAGFPVRSPDGHSLGSFCVVDNRPRAWTAENIRTLEVLAHAASGEVALRIAADEAVRARRAAEAVAEQYRQLAWSLQESLLPRDLPRIDGLDVAAAYRLSGSDVLGDFYDLAQTPTGWAVFLGDVTGKGPHAARTGALARYTLRASAMRATSPAIVITELDAALHRWFSETGVPGFVTVAYAALRPTRGGFQVRICTAGHPGVFIRRADGAIHDIGPTSSSLGILPRLSLNVHDDQLHSGDTLVLCSNGVLDARATPAGDTFGSGLRGVLAAADAFTAHGCAHQITEAALQYSGGEIRDDMVTVAIRHP